MKKIEDARVGEAVLHLFVLVFVSNFLLFQQILQNIFLILFRHQIKKSTAVQKETKTGATRNVRRVATNSNSTNTSTPINQQNVLPDWWIQDANTKKSCYVPVKTDSHELAKKAVKEFYSTFGNNLVILKQDQLQHKKHSMAVARLVFVLFCFCGQIFRSDNILFCFEGTHAKTVPEICSKGFLRDYNSTSLYGKGVYFARDASYPVTRGYAKFDDTNGYARLMYCRVICGESCVGKKDLIRPPTKPTGSDGVTLEYESFVDTVSNPSIVVCCTDFNPQKEINLCKVKK
ncbi:hypothetical protein RFI_00403 [Reticulomyxa filosa]|uniref:Poly [ADP-ribose] polymerase n=1 Tax=Reticulomyxa filosa TaxID=46433 RepID=X6PEX6_RETFI|nr:hypothetical protein RFI_00403 [Reticulomyxa filosa]|eukprot:ETO36658.1 hypothetical protein RFI_00403 [Reticulomyxa filosa]